MPKFLIWLGLVCLVFTPLAPNYQAQLAFLPFLAAGVGGLLGAVGGAFGSSSTSKSESGIKLSDPSSAENMASGLVGTNAYQLSQLFQGGPGASDYSAATDATRSLAALLQQYSQSGGLPSASDISTSNELASSLFGARRTALNQSFSDQLMESNRLAASLGRPINDPILQAKLRTGFMRQSDSLSAEENAFATDFALNLPGRRIGFAQDATNVLNSLADRAANNRLTLAQLGSSILGSERQFRLATGTQWSTGEQTSGGGVSGAINGFLGGAGAGLSVGTSLSGPGGFNLGSAMPMSFAAPRGPALGVNTNLGYGAPAPNAYSAPLSSQIASYRF